MAYRRLNAPGSDSTMRRVGGVGGKRRRSTFGALLGGAADDAGAQFPLTGFNDADNEAEQDLQVGGPGGPLDATGDAADGYARNPGWGPPLPSGNPGTALSGSRGSTAQYPSAPAPPGGTGETAVTKLPALLYINSSTVYNTTATTVGAIVPAAYTSFRADTLIDDCGKYYFTVVRWDAAGLDLPLWIPEGIVSTDPVNALPQGFPNGGARQPPSGTTPYMVYVGFKLTTTANLGGTRYGYYVASRSVQWTPQYAGQPVGLPPTAGGTPEQAAFRIVQGSKYYWATSYDWVAQCVNQAYHNAINDICGGNYSIDGNCEYADPPPGQSGSAQFSFGEPGYPAMVVTATPGGYTPAAYLTMWNAAAAAAIAASGTGAYPAVVDPPVAGGGAATYTITSADGSQTSTITVAPGAWGLQGSDGAGNAGGYAQMLTRLWNGEAVAGGAVANPPLGTAGIGFVYSIVYEWSGAAAPLWSPGASLVANVQTGGGVGYKMTCNASGQTESGFPATTPTLTGTSIVFAAGAPPPLTYPSGGGAAIISAVAAWNDGTWTNNVSLLQWTVGSVTLITAVAGTYPVPAANIVVVANATGQTEAGWPLPPPAPQSNGGGSPSTPVVAVGTSFSAVTKVSGATQPGNGQNTSTATANMTNTTVMDYLKPYLFWNPATNSFAFAFSSAGGVWGGSAVNTNAIGTDGYITFGMNAPLYALFRGFRAIQGTGFYYGDQGAAPTATNAPPGGVYTTPGYTLLMPAVLTSPSVNLVAPSVPLNWINWNSVSNPAGSPLVNLSGYYTWPQEYSSADALSPIGSLAFGSAMPLLFEATSPPGKATEAGVTSTSNESSSTFTDIALALEGGASDYLGSLSYVPSGEYRWIQFKPGSAGGLRQLDWAVYWTYRLTNKQYAVNLLPGGSVRAKFLLQRKDV